MTKIVIAVKRLLVTLFGINDAGDQLVLNDDGDTLEL
jgi:hypothetical protein